MTRETTATKSTVPAAPISIKLARTFLILFSTALALWIAALVAMYFTTVYPQRHPASKGLTSSNSK